MTAAGAPAPLRTPEERFVGLTGWEHPPRWFEPADGGPRMHYVDVGPPDAQVTALCLHGNPTWGYLYRHMIPVFSGAGLRVVAPDLIGCGRSDKPVDDGPPGSAWHGFDAHRQSLLALVDALDLRNVLVVVQDWGGLLGLTLPLAAPERFTRLLAMNTGLGTGTVTEGFRQWRAYSNSQPDLAVGRLMKRSVPHLSDTESAAYDAPFPDVRHKAALRAFPRMVPDGEQAPGAAISREAAAFWQQRWRSDSFMAIGMQDPVLGPPAMRALHGMIRGCPPPLEVAQGGHFLQEWGAPVAVAALAHFGLGGA